MSAIPCKRPLDSANMRDTSVGALNFYRLGYRKVGRWAETNYPNGFLDLPVVAFPD
jgi:hypothetical protein